MKKVKQISIAVGAALVLLALSSTPLKAKDIEVSACTGGKNICNGNSSGALIDIKI